MTTENTNVETQTNEVIVTFDGRDLHLPMEALGISMESTDRQVINACRESILEASGSDINDEYGNSSYSIRKALNTNTIYVYPKPIAG